MVSRGAITRKLESRLDFVEVGKRFVIGILDQIATDDNEVRFHGIDLFYRQFESRHIVGVAAHSQLGVAHLDEGERRGIRRSGWRFVLRMQLGDEKKGSRE